MAEIFAFACFADSRYGYSLYNKSQFAFYCRPHGFGYGNLFGFIYFGLFCFQAELSYSRGTWHISSCIWADNIFFNLCPYDLVCLNRTKKQSVQQQLCTINQGVFYRFCADVHHRIYFNIFFIKKI